jgi:protein gp37
MAKRLHAMGQPNYRNGFTTTLQPQLVTAPLAWKRPRRVFVNSMSDLFHEAVPTEFIRNVFDVMVRASWHQFQVLTKRSDRLASIGGLLDWPVNIWMGVSVESERYLSRIDDLRRCPARVRFLSLEPLLGPLPKINLDGIHWVIVGGESGPGARPMEKSWVVDILAQCQRAQVPFFFKQWGGIFKKRTGRLLDGQTWDQFPMLKESASVMFNTAIVDTAENVVIA